ncbi:RNA-binding domain-containing protein [Sporormia fimetaria CBS 119925]|uniref:RNA-binding domain-containing protein n=1 Tax=Sporormia fimetaria CBS 119925 TaxID=1340428 RepID=A0A6A6V6H6_9PLEO|nr:RNA-binding domain-containing protein [Sporormia fimetaria CBS 119925]
MNQIRAIQKLNKRELEEGISPEGSWHTDYRDTAFIYVGGLPFELSEGDIITLFSQYGEPVWIKLARDRETGKSRGFCWLKYEDQRSTDLAVDNLGGAVVMGRTLRVDHARYKPRDDEDMRDNTMGDVEKDENDKRRKRRRTESPSESEDSDEDRPLLKEEIALQKVIRDLDEEDPMKEAMVRQKREEAETAVARWKKANKKDKKHRSRRHHRDRDRSKDRHAERKRITDARDETRNRDGRERSRSRRRDDSKHRRRRDPERGRRHSSSEEDRHVGRRSGTPKDYGRRRRKGSEDRERHSPGRHRRRRSPDDHGR